MQVGVTWRALTLVTDMVKKTEMKSSATISLIGTRYRRGKLIIDALSPTGNNQRVFVRRHLPLREKTRMRIYFLHIKLLIFSASLK